MLLSSMFPNLCSLPRPLAAFPQDPSLKTPDPDAASPGLALPPRTGRPPRKAPSSCAGWRSSARASEKVRSEPVTQASSQPPLCPAAGQGPGKVTESMHA